MAPTAIARTPEAAVGLSQVLAALSHALDLTEGQPSGHAVRACVIGMRLAGALELPAAQRAALYYALLLKDIGCSANAAPTTDLFGADDHVVKRNLKTVDWSRFFRAAAYGMRNAGRGRPFLARVRHLLKVGAANRRGARQLVRIRCERGAAIVRRLGFPDETARGVRSLDEHWDGNGYPDGLAGPAIPLASRIALLAQTLDVFVIEQGLDAALDVAAQRSGTWFDPSLVRAVSAWRRDGAWWEAVYGPGVEQLALEAEPAEQVLRVDADTLDGVAEAFADVIDAKSPYTYRHSAGVADYARRAARELGCDGVACRTMYRAGLLHDIGKLAISNRILDKAGPLTPPERKAVESHPVYTYTILSHVDVFSDLARTAALHHERLDGDGYPWGLDADELDGPARMLATADVFEALTARRPYRDALSSETALEIMRRDVGRHLDAETVDALGVVVARGGPPAV